MEMMSGGLGVNGGLGQDISQEELDFSDLFPGEDFPASYDKDDLGVLLQDDNQPPLLVVDDHSAYVPSSSQSSSQNPPFHNPTTESLSEVVFDSLGLMTRPGIIPAPSPRIEITPSGDSLSSQTLGRSPGSEALGAYRECVSPASSNSSTGWAEVYSPSISPSNVGGVESSTSDLSLSLRALHTSSAHSSPGASPHNSVTEETFLLPHHRRITSPLHHHHHQRSRSASPQGKRTYDQVLSCQGGTPVKQRSRSPSPSPHQPQSSYYLHQYQAQVEFQPKAQTSSLGLEDLLSSLSSTRPRSIPSDVVRGAQGCAYGEGYAWAPEQERICRAAVEVKPETLYVLPAGWPPHPVHHGAFSGLSLDPLPNLERQLPTLSGQYELLIQQQPRSHHRAHYEIEGSRGAVKTPNGGHPEVQLHGYQGKAPLGLQVFIGTADERLLKPHAFYQVHRITGKTVTTPNMERMINGTNVLEIPLEPKNNMRVVINCVGILKLRNADIEQRNGETDFGRKNTRVRLVFRVHIPEPDGQIISLQVASLPIECSQRPAQELPEVQKRDPDRCSVLGGQQMILTGKNFTCDSKVVFSEKTQDGKQIWEMEAIVDRDKTQPDLLFVEIPPYRDHTIFHPAKVNFYVINGKKKPSQPQHFVYTPVIAIKSEPLDELSQLKSHGYSDIQFLSGRSIKSFHHHLEQDSNPPPLYHPANDDLRALLSDSLDDPLVYYQSRTSSHLSNPVPYHTADQHYSSADLLGGSLMASNSVTPSPVQYVSPSAPVDKLSQQVSNTFEGCLLTRHQSFSQTTLSLGESTHSQHIQDQPQGGRGHHDAQPPQRGTVKQETLSCAPLEHDE
ncbi:nuclear factor of activated T-cells, cytoplasmic 2 [Aulostomus maculatus]